MCFELQLTLCRRRQRLSTTAGRAQPHRRYGLIRLNCFDVWIAPLILILGEDIGLVLVGKLSFYYNCDSKRWYLFDNLVNELIRVLFYFVKRKKVPKKFAILTSSKIDFNPLKVPDSLTSIYS